MTGRIDEFDGVARLTPIPADEIAVAHLPVGEGLKNGDEGAVVDALHRDRGWVTVEFFRNGKTVAVTDVPLTHLRLIWKAPTAIPAPEPAQRTAD
ncbi:MAG: hypothetical protein ACR2M3_16475 [Thermomicrobiales bacterium]